MNVYFIGHDFGKITVVLAETKQEALEVLVAFLCPEHMILSKWNWCDRKKELKVIDCFSLADLREISSPTVIFFDGKKHLKNLDELMERDEKNIKYEEENRERLDLEKAERCRQFKAMCKNWDDAERD